MTKNKLPTYTDSHLYYTYKPLHGDLPVLISGTIHLSQTMKFLQIRKYWQSHSHLFHGTISHYCNL